MEPFLDKIFVINLPDRLSRWKAFENLDSRINRFEAIDSRENPYIFKNFGLKLNPVGVNQEVYFSQSKGAVGCYLSHFSLWKKIINENIPYCLIVEDDAQPQDLKDFLGLNLSFHKHYDLIQLNKRTSLNHNIFKNYFNGTESYIITRQGAQKLLDFTRDRVDFQNLVKSCPLDGWMNLYPSQYKVYKEEGVQDWSVPNSISAAVDKFIGFCSYRQLPPRKKINIKVFPYIGLNNYGSDILDSESEPHWAMSEKRLSSFMNSKNFKWWEREKNS